MQPDKINFYSEFVFKTSRSGGAGGQHVNKVSSKVELDFDVDNSALLTEEQKTKIHHHLKSRINKQGVLQIVVQEERSQMANKEIAIQKFYELIKKCFAERKKRKATRPSKSSKEKRIRQKKLHAEIKTLRKRI